MNWPSARSMRASWLFSTVKREPESLAARSKSIMPSASPISKCSLTQFGRAGTSPTMRLTTLSCSSWPTGTSSSGMLGNTASASFSPLSSSRSRASPFWMNALISLTSPLSFSAIAASPERMALPISFEAALRRSCLTCSSLRCARRASSLAIRSSTVDCASPADHERFTSASTRAFGLSRIHLMSSMVDPSSK